MAIEQDRTLAALQVAIKMEVDGKEYYLKANHESSSELGKKLLQSLAAEEDVHRRKFEEIYNALRAKKFWSVTDFKPDGGKRLRTIFARATEAMGSSAKTLDTELDAVNIAMGMENKTHDFYEGQSKNALYDAEREFYEILAGEEREHYLILADYYEYIKDPAGWFVMKEHRLDAG